MSSSVRAEFSDDGRRVELFHDAGRMCELRCAPLVLDPDGMYIGRQVELRLLTVGAFFDVRARDWFVEHARKDGWDEDDIQIRSFLAYLYRQVCIKRRVLTSHDILGHGYAWGKADIAEVTANMEGSAWERVLALTAESGRPAVDDDGRPVDGDEYMRERFNALLWWRSPWLRPLQGAQQVTLTDSDTELVGRLRDWDAIARSEMESDVLRADACSVGDTDELSDEEATTLHLRFQAKYGTKLRSYLQDVKRKRNLSGVGSPESLARILWQGRREFIDRFHLAAEAVYRALLRCPDFTDLEAEAFRMVNANSWPMVDGILRVDEVFREFLLFGEEADRRAIPAAFAGLTAGGKDALLNLRQLLAAYLHVTQLYMEMQRAAERERKSRMITGDLNQMAKHLPEEDALLPLAPVSGGIDWESLADSEAMEQVLAQMSSDKRRLAMQARMSGCTRTEAAAIAQTSLSTVTRAEQQMRELIRRLLQG